MNNLKRQIDMLCGKVIAAPDGSEEFKSAMHELRNALADHAEHLRLQVADLRQKSVPHRDDLG